MMRNCWLRWTAGLAILAACESVQAAQLPLRHYTTADGLASNAVYGIASDSRGFLWFATAEGLSRFDGFGFWNQTRSTGLPTGTVRRVLVGRHGNFWLATPVGLVRFRPDLPRSSPDRILVIRTDAKPGASRINVLFEARDGTLWCGTDAGLYTLSDTTSPAPRLAEVGIGLPGLTWGDSEVTALTEDAQGGLWIGTTDGTLYRSLPDHSVVRYSTGESLPDGGIAALLTDRKGRLWIGSGKNLAAPTAPSHTMRQIFHERGGRRSRPDQGT
jgi:two-component system, sensor histidine kinase and response regulator